MVYVLEVEVGKSVIKAKICSRFLLTIVCSLLWSSRAGAWDVSAWFTPSSESICPCDDDGGNPFTPDYNQTCDKPIGSVHVYEHGPYLIPSSEPNRTYGYNVKVTIAGESQSASTTATLYLDEKFCLVNCQNGVCNLAGGDASGFGDSINTWLYLGKSARGAYAGYLWIKADVPSLLLATPHGLILKTTADDVEAVTYLIAGTNVLRQVMAPECLADIVINNDFKYTVSFYHPDDVEAELDTNGYYVIKSDRGPFVAYTIENPAASTDDFDTLRITKVISSSSIVTEYIWKENYGAPGWALSTGNGLRYETMSALTNGIDRVVTRMVMDGSQVVASKTRETFRTFDWGEAIVEKVVDPDGAALATTKTFYTDVAKTGRYSQVASVINPDGSWERYDYDEQGHKTVVVASWKDAPITASADNVCASYYDYTSVDDNDNPSRYRTFTPRTTTEKILGIVVGKTYNAYYLNLANERVEITEKCVNPDSTYDDPSNLRTERIYNPKEEYSPGSERLKSVIYPDGRKDSYTYEFGTWSRDSDPALCIFTPGEGEDIRVTLTHGTTENPAGIAYKTTKEVSIEDHVGRVVMQETYAYNGNGYERIDWTVRDLDDLGRPLTVHRSNGTHIESTWACCGKEWEQDENGVEYSYLYDALNRVTLMVKQGIAEGTYPAQPDIYTAYTYDAEGRQLTATVSAGGLSQVSSNTYDLADRLTKSVDASGLVTEYAYQDGGRITIATLPGEATQITERYIDGKTKSITGTGVVPQYYDYGVNADGSQWTVAASVSEWPPASPNMSQWNFPWAKTTTDLLGRTAKVERPGYLTTEVTEYVYNNKGQLVKTTTSGQADTLYVYDELGNQIRSGLDVDDNGELDLASMDRITGSETIYHEISGIWYLESISRIYPTDNSAVPLTNSITRQRLTGLADPLIAESRSLDINGNETITTITVDRPNKTVIQTITYPDSINDAVSITLNDLLVSSDTKTGVEYSYGYDALGRRCSSRSVSGPGGSRSVATVTHYDSHGWLDYTEDAVSNRTWYTYDPETGRRAATTDALGNTSYSSYDVRGQLLATWGTTYPVAYEYDDYGRMIAMYTLRDPSISITDYSSFIIHHSSFDKTTWLYDLATGLLTNKLYADGKGVSYTYTPDGKLASRVWAREPPAPLLGGAGGGLLTTYSYDPMTSELLSIDYSDSTPDLTFTFNRLGRQKTITDALGSRTFTYNDALQLAAETNVFGVIERTYDSLGRNTGFTVADGGDVGYSVTYGFDNMGRFGSITSAIIGVHQRFDYSYLPNSDLISQLSTDNGLLITRAYEAHRNLLTQIQNNVGATSVSRFDYLNDPLARRTSATYTGSAFDALANTFNRYTYNDRSELISSYRFWGTDPNAPTADPVSGQQFAFAYDNIGNRVTSDVGAVPRTANYTANELNQYLQRTVQGYVDILGEANPEATITVNREPVTRQQAYWHKELEVENDAEAVREKVHIVGVLSNVVSSEKGYIFLPQDPEQFTYDQDGNMTSDGRFIYEWNCENRLIAVEDKTGKVPGRDWICVRYTYDYMGRRVRKQCYTWSMACKDWMEDPYKDLRFVYDGWNLICEQIKEHRSPTGGGGGKDGLPEAKEFTYSTNFYVWGLDLSGSLQGAGGIGGLLAQLTTDNGQPATYLYTCDGNGNITDILQPSSLDIPPPVVAHYEYDPYGNLLVATGPAVFLNSFLFSTKYLDRETGLYYYGQRYYSPELGRWLTRDPIGEVGGENLYHFVFNDPCNDYDYLGWGIGDIIDDIIKKLFPCYCCCAETIDLMGGAPARFDDKGPGVDKAYYHDFTVTMKTSKKEADKTAPCTWTWNESISADSNYGTYYMAPGGSVLFDSGTIKPGGTKSIHDQPGMSMYEARLPGQPKKKKNGKRDLTIVFTVTSAGGCPCANSSKSVTIVQKLKFNSGVPDTGYEAFIVTSK